MSHYHHLTLRDRVFISALTISGKSLSEIACAIGKNVSTISRELKRNKAVSAQDGASAAYDPCGICQDTSKKLVRSLFIPEEPQQGLCPYASLPQDIFLR